jgi:hypothetical protein
MEELHRLHTNAVPFYTRDLRSFGFWYPWRTLEPICCGYREMMLFALLVYLCDNVSSTSF